MQNYAKFNGYDSWIRIPNLNHTDRSFTRILLFKLEKNNRNIIVGDYSSTSSPGCNWEIHTDNKLRVYWHGGKIDKYGKSIPLNKVLRMAMVRDKENDKFLIYIDDEIYLDVDGAKMDSSYRNFPLQFGFDGRSSTAFKGGMSNISIWDRALTPKEISRYSSHRLFGNEKGLECYLDMDHINEKERIIYDSSPNENHANYNSIKWEQEGDRLNSVYTNIIQDDLDGKYYDISNDKILRVDGLSINETNVLDNINLTSLSYNQIMDKISKHIYKNSITGKFIDDINIKN